MSTICQPETRSLKQIKRDYHRSLYPPLRQRMRTASDRVIRGILCLLVAVIGAAIIYALGIPTVLNAIFILIVLSFFTG